MIGSRALAIVLLLNAGLCAAIAVALLYRSVVQRRRADARARVRQQLAALTQHARDAGTPDLAWWLAHADALAEELTTPLASHPSLRAALEAVSLAAAGEIVRLCVLAGGPLPKGSRTRAHIRQLARLVVIAPTRPARRALMALQAADDDALAVPSLVAIARHAESFTDASASLAYALSLAPSQPRALALRAALSRVIDADQRRAAIHLRDDVALVRSVALSTLDANDLPGAPAERDALVSRTLTCTSDADAGVRAAAFAALPRVATGIAAADIERGLRDPVAIVRSAAARAVTFSADHTLTLLRVLDRSDAGGGRLVRLALRAQGPAEGPGRAQPPATAAERVTFFQRLAVVPVPEAENLATGGLTDADAAVRREAALALAALARTGRTPRLGPATIDALLEELPTESSSSVVRALVEALEASGDARAAEQLAAHATRAKLGWRVRLVEAAALARHLHTQGERRSRRTPSHSQAKPR